jgi:prepilin-type N-terminal cleavage/methylation domain-containing protein
MRGAAARGDAGWTLMELLVVIVLIAILLGLAVGAFFLIGRGAAGAAAVQATLSMLRSARETARGGGLPAFVTFDAQERRAVFSAAEAVHVWDLDLPPPAGSDSVAAPGRIGMAWRTGAREVVLGTVDPVVGDGFFVEVWVFPESAARSDPVALAVGRVELGVNARMMPRARVGGLQLEGRSPVPVGRWSRLALVATPEGDVRMLLDEAEAARGRIQPGSVRVGGEEVRVGSRSARWPGLVDEVLVGAVRVVARLEYPPDARIEFPGLPPGTARLEIEFAPDGRVARGSTVRVVHPDGTWEVEADPSGRIERRRVPGP